MRIKIQTSWSIVLLLQSITLICWCWVQRLMLSFLPDMFLATEKIRFSLKKCFWPFFPPYSLQRREDKAFQEELIWCILRPLFFIDTTFSRQRRKRFPRKIVLVNVLRVDEQNWFFLSVLLNRPEAFTFGSLRWKPIPTHHSFILCMKKVFGVHP